MEEEQEPILENDAITVDDQIIKPKAKKKRVPTPKQLEALAKAREKRALKTKQARESRLKTKKPEKQKSLTENNPEPLPIVETPEPLPIVEPEVIEEPTESIEEIEPPPPPRRTRQTRKKVIKVVKRKRVKKPPKEIIYENSSSESDDDELLSQVYQYYKKELRGRKKNSIKSQVVEDDYTPQHFNLKFV